MTTSSEQSSARSTDRVPLRIRLDNGFPSRPLDGAWWPQSRDLQVECADLIDHFPGLVGRPARLLFSRPDWDAAAGGPSARTIRAARGPVKVGSFPNDDTHLMIVVMSSRERLRLLVIPSSMEPDIARTLMAEAADERNTRSAAALLATARLHSGGVSPFATSVWEDEGGAEGRSTASA
ncbi:DUF5994 family protein [Nocardioides daeguensis]|uniref:Uncharacterized protein n=1 Tax=Nocardioides daeguensis TaxID=908359 RepID=A0ABP6V742_9ACTN|nr:DUF5994 family protein [Nocardioides daeguensis]MBV6726452.1 hypothetical protein [Nocardioides daeguensis]MCR1772295.1 hypothetical protein [Nocardioides daeguensis]